MGSIYQDAMRWRRARQYPSGIACKILDVAKGAWSFEQMEREIDEGIKREGGALVASYYSVITTKDGVVDTNLLLVGENGIIDHGGDAGKKISKVAEKYFLDECQRVNSDFLVKEARNIEDILDDGYYEFERWAVCIGEPEVR